LNKSTRLAFLAVLPCAVAMGDEPNLEELQRRLDAAKRQQQQQQQQQKPRVPSVPKAAPPRQSTLVVRSDSACRLSIDGNAVAEMEAGVVRTLTTAVGEALVECQSTAENDARYSLAYKFEADTKVVIQIELRDKILSARRQREAAVAQARQGAASQAPPARRAASQASQASQPTSAPTSVTAASAARTPGSAPVARRADGGASTAQAASAQEWSRALEQLRRDGNQTSLARGLSTVLSPVGAEDSAHLEQFEALMKRLIWHAALAMGERSGYISYGWSYRHPRASVAQEAALAVCNSRSRQPCVVVMTDGKMDHAALVDVAARLGAQPQPIVLRNFMGAVRATLKNAP